MIEWNGPTPLSPIGKAKARAEASKARTRTSDRELEELQDGRVYLVYGFSRIGLGRQWQCLLSSPFFRFFRPSVYLSNYFLRAVDSAWLPLDSSGSLQHQITELLPSRLRPMVCYRLRFGGYPYVTNTAIAAQADGFATARDLGGNVIIRLLPL